VSNRRKLKTATIATTPGEPEHRPPWNRGLTLTARPSVSTVRRQVRAMEAGGLTEHTTERTGKPGRPPHLLSLTRDGVRLWEIADMLERAGWDTAVLRPGQVDLLISHGWAARREDGTAAFLENYQEYYRYWRSKGARCRGDGAMVMPAAGIPA
jgi:hypothetical protein